jgi:hypothetical protein
VAGARQMFEFGYSSDIEHQFNDFNGNAWSTNGR